MRCAGAGYAGEAQQSNLPRSRFVRGHRQNPCERHYARTRCQQPRRNRCRGQRIKIGLAAVIKDLRPCIEPGDRMTHRRKFVGLLGGAAASGFLRPLTVRAQQRLPRVGIIDNTPMWDPFRQALRELGYIEGRSIAFEYRESTGTPAGLTAAAGELAQLSVDVIATYGTVATRAARDATSRIPIVMIGIGEPVGSGLVTNLGRPGANITGNTVLSADT